MAVQKSGGTPTSRVQRQEQPAVATRPAPAPLPAKPARLDDTQVAQQTALGDTGQLNSNFVGSNEQAGQVAKNRSGVLNFMLQQGAATRAQETGPADHTVAAPGSWQDQLHRAQSCLGSSMVQAGGTLREAGGLLGPTPLGLQAAELGASCETFGQSVASAPPAAVVDTVATHQQALGLADRAARLYQDGLGQLKKGLTATREGVEKIGDGAKAAANAAKAYVDDVGKAVDYQDNIAKLGDGDSYAIGVDGFLGIEGVRATGRGSIEVTRNAEDDYTVAVSGGLGAGLYVEFGAKVGNMGLAVDASAIASAGGTVEFSFKTPEEAASATGLILDHAKNTMVSAAVPLGGLVTARSAAKNAEAIKGLSKNISAIELSGDITGEVFGILGIKGVIGGLGAVDVGGESAVRLEFGEDGPAVVTRQTAHGYLGGDIGISLRGGDQYLTGVEGSGEASVSLERRFQLPPGINLDALRNEPVKTLRAAAQEMQKTSVDTLSMEYSLEGGAFGRSAGISGSLSLEVSAAEVARSGAIPKALRGDFKGALAALPESAVVSGETQSYDTHGVKVYPYFTVMGFGGGVEMLAQRTDVDAAKTRSFERPAREAFGELVRTSL